MSDTPRTDALLKEWECWSLGDAGSLFVELARELERQLPDGMKHCTIVFKECDKGHGWLTATNWVQHGCPTCALEERHKALAAAKDFDTGVDLKKAHDRAVEYANQAREACFEPTSFDLPQVRSFWRYLYAKEFAALTRP